MQFLNPLGAVLLLLILTVVAVSGNDDFAQRLALPSTESVELDISRPATLSYEPLDPLQRSYGFGDDADRRGSLWYEWTAPRDGWFRAAAVKPDGSAMETFVYEGQSLEHLLRIQNGNTEGISWDNTSVFPAVQGRKYQIAVQAVVSAPSAEIQKRAAGLLRLTPAPEPPSNDKLATRHVLSGPLPLTVTATNFTTSSLEAGLLREMTLLNSSYFYYGNNTPGPALWWEWTCPATGIYDLRANTASHWLLIGKRRSLPGGGVSGPGEWAPGGVTAPSNTFQAASGEVFDIALTGRNSYGPGNLFGLVSLTLKEVTAAIVPPPSNLTEDTALQLPATLPFAHHEFWGAGTVPRVEYGVMQLWYRFTAPAEGYYEFNFNGAWPIVIFEGGNGPTYTGLTHLGAGEDLFLLYYLSQSSDTTIGIAARTLPTLPVADNIADAVDLGSVTAFTLRGHTGQATLELTEPEAPFLNSPVTGSLWWRWTAPAAGWIYPLGGGGNGEYLDIVRADLSGRADLSWSPFQVQAGETWLIRANFRETMGYRLCNVDVAFLPRPANLSWQTAEDLGVSALPLYAPPPGPAVWLAEAPWFRWTAAETLRGGLASRGPDEQTMIFTDPAAGTLLPRDAASYTWQFIAGQTYWLQHDQLRSDAWFQMERAPLTAHGDLATALVLPSTLPAGGTISTRGDTNSPVEYLVLNGLIWSGLLDTCPAVWWKWQAPHDQMIRFETGGIEGNSLNGTFVFSGTDPAVQTEVEPLASTPGDYYGRYLRVRQGETYWFAAVGGEDTGKRTDHVRLDIRTVIEAGPANDNFASRTGIAANAWRHSAVHTGIHHGGGLMHPLRYEWTFASLEPGEPPVSLVIGEEGNAVPQTASTWWQWTAPVDGIYSLFVQPSSGPGSVITRHLRSGGGDPEPFNDLTVNVYTGGSLATLQAIALYEPVEASYLFRATAGTQYSIRVASGSHREFYDLDSINPTPSDLFDYHAVETLSFEDVGAAWQDYAGDDIPNCLKLIFGMDYYLPADHPANVAAVSGKLPRQVVSDGWLELRCHPDPSLAPGGDTALFAIPGLISNDLENWLFLQPVSLPDGELSLRAPASDPRLFLQWDPLHPGWGF